MWLLFTVRICKEPVGHPFQVPPQRFPLLLFVPYVRPLKQRHQKTLRLTENRIRGSNLSFHKDRFFVFASRNRMIKGAHPASLGGASLPAVLKKCQERIAWIVPSSSRQPYSTLMIG